MVRIPVDSRVYVPSAKWWPNGNGLTVIMWLIGYLCLTNASDTVRDPGTQGVLLVVIGALITIGGSLFLVLFREVVKSLRTLNRTLHGIDRRLVAVEVKMGIPIDPNNEGNEHA